MVDAGNICLLWLAFVDLSNWFQTSAGVLTNQGRHAVYSTNQVQLAFGVRVLSRA